MATERLSKPTFILAFESSDKLAEVSNCLHNLFPHAVIFNAHDGSDAMSKIRNSPPHVLITEDELPKVKGTKIADWLFGDTKLRDTAIILIGAIPDEGIFPDEVVIGRLQFLDDFGDEARFSSALSRALNYSTASHGAEFRLKYLAANEVLLREGEKANFVYILRRGGLRAYVVRGNIDLSIGKIEPGEFVGEMAYINGEARSANVAANIESELIEIPIDSLDLVLFQKPSWSRALMITLSKRVKIGNDTLGKAK